MRLVFVIFLSFVFLAWSPFVLAQGLSKQTLCVMNFIALGDVPEQDWLSSGLSDMAITALDKASPYKLLSRKEIRTILEEQGLAKSELSDEVSYQIGKIAKADFLLLGSYAYLDKQTIHIQARLVRMSDQMEVARVKWQGTEDMLLSAPIELALSLQKSLGQPVFDNKGALEEIFPRTVNSAKAFYLGISYFEDGDYVQALASFLESSDKDPSYLRSAREAMRMYDLFDQKQHSLIFADNYAEGLIAEGEIASALEFLYEGAKRAQEVDDTVQAFSLLDKLIGTADLYEKRTGEAVQAQRDIEKKLELLRAEKPKEKAESYLSHPDIRHKIWSGDIQSDLEYRERIDYSYWVQRDGKWAEEDVPPPSVNMWRIVALLDRARLRIKSGDGPGGFEDYRSISDSYAFLHANPIFTEKDRLFWRTLLRNETHFMSLYNYKQTGHLLRDKELTSKMIDIQHDSVIKRDYSKPGPDKRARTWSEHAYGGHEFFDFAAPDGYQIDSIKLKTNASGKLQVSVYHANASGWPPRMNFTSRIKKFKPGKGKKLNSIKVPPGNGVVSLSFYWGSPLDEPSLADLFNTQKKHSRPINSWQAEFKISPLQAINTGQNPGASSSDDSSLKLIKNFASDLGWDRARVLMEEEAVALETLKKEDVYAQKWITYAANEDIHIINQDNPAVKVSLPVSINTADREAEPELIHMHDGTLALIWVRGQYSKPQGYFIARTNDLRVWSKPQKLVFEDKNINQERKHLWRANITALPDNHYVMLLQDGFAMYSEDLRHWSKKEKIIDEDILRSSMGKAEDGRYWLAAGVASSYPLKAGEKPPHLYGWYRDVGGKIFVKLEDLKMYHSNDGISWSKSDQLKSGPVSNMIRTFPTRRSGMGVASIYFGNQLALSFFKAGDKADSKDPKVRVFVHDGSSIKFFLHQNTINCAVVVQDLTGDRGQVLLILQKDL